MTELTVKIENFEGPLELLLHLVEKNKLEISKINMMELIETYLNLINSFQESNVNLKVEFLTMATELLEIKALSILNKDEHEEKEEELEQRLIKYHRYKMLSQKVSKLEKEHNIAYERNGIEKHYEETKELDLSKLTLEKVFQTYYRVLDSKTLEELEIVIDEQYSLEDEMQALKELILKVKKQCIKKIFEGAKSKLHLVYLFLGILELYRNGDVYINEAEQIIQVNGVV